MTIPEVASYFRISIDTLRYWRHIGFGPTGRRVGRHVLYNRSEVEAFWASEKDVPRRDTSRRDA